MSTGVFSSSCVAAGCLGLIVGLLFTRFLFFRDMFKVSVFRRREKGSWGYALGLQTTSQPSYA